MTGQGLFDIVRHRLRWKRVFLYLGLGVFAAIPASTANPAGQVGAGELSAFQIILKACYTLFKYPVATIVPTKLSLRYRVPTLVAGSSAGIQLTNPWYAASLAGVGLLVGWLAVLAARLLCTRPWDPVRRASTGPRVRLAEVHLATAAVAYGPGRPRAVKRS